MSLSPIDWTIIVVYLIGCAAAGVWMRRYVRGVEDFAVAGRAMKANLGVASLAATEIGIVTVMYTAEQGFKYGPAGAIPGVLGCITMLLIGGTGFIIVPLRNAGVITIPELFEKRFGVRVRWLAGLVVILGGVLNMGIFLRLGGDFLVHVTGMPEAYTIGGVEVRCLELMMTSLLVVVLVYTVLGGMLSVLVTDYLQFLVMGLGIVITSVVVVWSTGWTDFVSGLWDAFRSGTDLAQTGDIKAAPRSPLTMAHPFNPFVSLGVWWVIWQSIHQVAVATTWQTTIARVLSAKDASTAKSVYRRTSFYYVGRFGLPGLWGAAAFLYFAGQGGLPAGLDTLTAMPAYLRHVIPTGLIGMLLAGMLAAEMSTDSGYLLTWATVIYNDLISPVLPRPLSPKGKLLLIRLLVLAIGLFLVVYGLWYELPGSAWEYLAVTGNIYLASLFALLVGALYWRGANSWGAIAAIVLGAVGPVTFLVVNAVVDKKSQIPAEWAGMSAFVMAFGGLFIGSLAARAFGYGYSGPMARGEGRDLGI